MTAPDPIDVAFIQLDEKKEKLKKAFDDLQSHRSLLSPSFALSWSEIDSHFSSLKSSLLNRFRLLQSTAPCPESDRIEASKEDTTETPVLWPQLRTFCEEMDGKGLGKYMIDHSKKRLSMKVDLSASIRCSTNPAALVLDAIEGSYNLPSSLSAKQIDGRRIFVLLLEALIEINANLTDDMRERARSLAYDWKSKIGNKPSEALGFLLLVAAFELESLFNTEELADYILMISTYKQATSICKKLGLCRERIADLIHKLLATDRQLIAIRFIYEFEMTDKFQPVSILKSNLKNSREAAKRVCVEGKDSHKSQNEATGKEISALRAVIKVIKEQNLESEFSQENLEECVKQLENQKAQRRRTTKSTTHGNPQQPQQLQKSVTKRPRIAANGTPAGYNLRMPVPNQQQPFLPNPNHGLQINPYGLLRSTLPGVTAPYGNPLAGFYGSAPGPGPAPRPAYYDQQIGNKGYGLTPQFRPPYFPH